MTVECERLGRKNNRSFALWQNETFTYAVSQFYRGLWKGSNEANEISMEKEMLRGLQRGRGGHSYIFKPSYLYIHKKMPQFHQKIFFLIATVSLLQ